MKAIEYLHTYLFKERCTVDDTLLKNLIFDIQNTDEFVAIPDEHSPDPDAPTKSVKGVNEPAPMWKVEEGATDTQAVLGGKRTRRKRRRRGHYTRKVRS